MEVRELAVPDTAAASARALAALKLFRLFSRCPNGSAGIPPALLFSAVFPADTDLLGEPCGDFLPPEPAYAGRGFAFSVMASKLGQILLHHQHSHSQCRRHTKISKQCASILIAITQPLDTSPHRKLRIPNNTTGHKSRLKTLLPLIKPRANAALQRQILFSKNLPRSAFFPCGNVTTSKRKGRRDENSAGNRNFWCLFVPRCQPQRTLHPLVSYVYTQISL